MSATPRAAWTIVIAIATAVLSASVFPWIPLIRWCMPIATTLLVLLAWSSPPLMLIGFSVIAPLLADTIAGYPIGARSAFLLVTLALCWPLVRSYVRQRRMGPLLLTAMALSVAEATAISLAAGGFPPARWALLFRSWWLTAAWGLVLSIILHRMIVRRRAPYARSLRSH